jgi:hypothetical protein
MGEGILKYSNSAKEIEIYYLVVVYSRRNSQIGDTVLGSLALDKGEEKNNTKPQR